MIRQAGAVAAMVLALMGTAAAKTFDIRPGADAEGRLQAAFAEARPGDAIVIRAGRYELSTGLRLTSERVTVRGDGPDRSILSFAFAAAPAPAMVVLGDQVTLRDFAIEDAKGDGVRALGADRLLAANMMVAWTAPSAAAADAISVSDASGVDLQKVIAANAPGAGIRLSGVSGSIVRDSQATGNGVGLAIHNGVAVDVISNVFDANATGVLVRDRPGAAIGGGRDVRLFRNRIESNNGLRPAESVSGGGLAPSTGVGVAILGARNVHVRENIIAEHATVGALIMADPEPANDPAFNALPRDIALVSNAFGRSGFAPAGGSSVFDGADIVWDGAEIYVAGGQVRSEPVRLSLQANVGLAGPAVFSNLQLAAAGADPADAAPDPTPPDAVALTEPQPVEIRR